MTWLFSRRVCISSLKVLRDYPPPLPSFLSKGKVGRKGEISSHWPRADATALRRKERGTKSHRFFTYCEGKGEGVLSSAPTHTETPLSTSPLSPVRMKSEQPRAGVQPPQQLGCNGKQEPQGSNSCLAEARRAKDSLWRARRRLRPVLPGSGAPAPNLASVGEVRGLGTQ